MLLPKSEIDKRKQKFLKLMNEKCPDWDIAVFFDRVNQYYFTGTKQNSVLIFLKNGQSHYFVKKSYKRAKMESRFDNIHPMSSFKDIPKAIGEQKYTNGYVEMSKLPMGLYNMINKYLQIENVKSVDGVIGYQRSVKSEYELEIMKAAASRHNYFLREVVPTLLKEDISELEFAALYGYEMIKNGHQGTLNYNMFQANTASGDIAFGENAVYPTAFDGPGGAKGLYPAQAKLGDPDRRLKAGDMVFADWDFAMYGYQSDITQIYMFKGKVDDEMLIAHNECIRIKDMAAKMLKPGAIPSEIYNTVVDTLDEKYKDSFMGANNENVKFLGHSLGLSVDELPVIAPRYDVPLEKNMVVALEPKISFEGKGLVGVEDTYIVTEDGGLCITGGLDDIIEVE